MKTYDMSNLSREEVVKLKKKYNDYADEVRSISLGTIKLQQVYLDRLFYGLKINCEDDVHKRLTASKLSLFLDRYANEHGVGSTKWMTKTLRSFLRFCTYYHLIDRDLLAIVPTVQQRALAHIPKAISEADIAQLIRSITGTSPADLRDLAIISLLSTYGVRGGQIRELKLTDIDWDNQQIHFPEAKGGRDIVQPFTENIGDILAAYLKGGRPLTLLPEVFLHLTAPVHAFNRSSDLSLIIYKRLKGAGITLPDGVSQGTHGFRHAFAARHVGNLPFEQLGNMMGHRSLRSTLLYSKISFSTLQEAALPWPEED
jgi:integrase/recombinase XerD